METKELLKKVRRIEIKTRGLVNQVFSGEYHSVFKGRGMEFSEVREYQMGDDIRNIDWNVTARFGHPFIKIFEEERELTVILLVDLSGSQFFGTVNSTKKQIAAELSSILAFSALKNNDKVGLILFSDTVEKFIPPRKSRSHILRIIRELISFKPKGKSTDIKAALEFFNHAIKKKAIVFLISDFLDSGYEKILKIVGKKHDLVGVVLRDEKELNLPKIGLVDFIDPESGQTEVFDTSSKVFRDRFKKQNQLLDFARRQIFLASKLDNINIDTRSSYIPALIKFFKMRESRW